MMSIHTLFTASKEYIKQAKNVADSLNCDIHMHLSESPVKFTGDKKIEKFYYQPMKPGEIDDSGRRKPVATNEDPISMEVDNVILNYS